MEIGDDCVDLQCQRQTRLLENKLSFDQRPQRITGQVRYPSNWVALAHPNPMEGQIDGGGPGGGPGREMSGARTLQPTPIGSFTKVIASPTDRPTPRTDQTRAIEGSSPPTIAPPKMAHDEAIETPRRKAFQSNSSRAE